MKLPKMPKLPFGKHKSKSDSSDADIHIKISPLMFVMAAAFFAQGRAYDFVCSIAAVILHECAHAKVAKRLGYALNEIKVMPYGAALCGDENIFPRHEIMIAVAGPVFNLVLAAAFAALWWLVPTSYAFTRAFCECNIYIGLFNLLPVYPLDGGRIAFCLLGVKLGKKRAYTVMRIISGVIGCAALAGFIASAFYAPNVCLLTVGIFMVVSAMIPDKRAKYRQLYGLPGKSKMATRPVEIRRFAVGADVALGKLVGMLDPDAFCEFEVYDGEEFMCDFDENDLVSAVQSYGYDAKLKIAAEKKKTLDFTGIM